MIRLAGRGRGADGRLVTWTLAEGRRGRRWREVVADRGLAGWSLLYETDPAGRFSHLELATAQGLATLHPEADGTLHGNVVDADGVRHIEGLPFPADAVLVVVGSSVAGAAVAGWVAGHAPPAAGIPAVVLDPATLGLRARPFASGDVVPVDSDGVPQLVDATVWPLEREAEADRG